MIPVRQALARQAPMGRASIREAMAAGGADIRRPGSLVPLRSLREAQGARRALVSSHPPSAPRAAPLLRAIPALRG
jgi:hypothetical protein